jgi:hypothetical protein
VPCDDDLVCWEGSQRVDYGLKWIGIADAAEGPNASPGWRELARGELVHVNADLRIDSSIVLDDPPAHQLGLQDLDRRAAASQKPIARAA